MPSISEAEIQSMEREAQGRLRAGELDSAIQVQTALVEKLLEIGPKAFHSQPQLAEHLESASGQLIDSLRWSSQYAQAIALQEQLLEYLPGLADALRLGAANLRVEGGDSETGLAQIHEMAKAQPDNYWFKISLASAYMFLFNFDEAEKVLHEAAEMTHVRKVDRAMAQEYLFELYSRQAKMDEALTAWREACRLDSSLRSEMLPRVCRMLIYQRKVAEAKQHIAHDPVQVRRLFYTGLLAFMDDRAAEAAEAWKSVILNHDPHALKAGQEAYAEICLHLGNPVGAIQVLEPLVNEGQTNFERMLLLALAYAQKGDLEKARRNFSIALRLGDLDRPRRTLPSEHGRIFDQIAAVLYASIPIHPAARKEIDLLFKSK